MAPSAYITCTQDSTVLIVLLLAWNALVCKRARALVLCVCVCVCVCVCIWRLDKEALCGHDFPNCSSIFHYITVYKTAFLELPSLFHHDTQSIQHRELNLICWHIFFFFCEFINYLKKLIELYLKTWAHGRAVCLRHCDTSRKVEGSIPEGVIDIILPPALWPLGSTQPLTEMSTRNISWGLNVAGA
jgi:hypothetical protein